MRSRDVNLLVFLVQTGFNLVKTFVHLGAQVADFLFCCRACKSFGNHCGEFLGLLLDMFFDVVFHRVHSTE